MTLYFGVNVERDLRDWFHKVFVPELREKYGEEMEITAIVASHRPGICISQLPMPIFSGGSKTGEELATNVYRKLRFVLRTGLPSSYARQRPDLVEPGDFPWAGAGIYKGYVGGVSGLNEESDWWVYERIVDKLIELRAEVAKPAITASKNRVEGWKYLEGNGKPPEPEKAINS